MTPRDLQNVHTTGNSCRDALARANDTKTTLTFLPAGGKASWLLLPNLVSLLSGGTVQPKNTYSPYPEGNRSGLGNPKKDKHQHLYSNLLFGCIWKCS